MGPAARSLTSSCRLRAAVLFHHRHLVIAHRVARLRRRLLLALAVVTGSVVAVVSLLIALVLFHAGWLGFALVALLALGALVAAAAVGLAWMARRMWRRGAWLEALPLLAGQPWLSRVVWAARLIWTGRSLWRLRARLRPASRY